MKKKLVFCLLAVLLMGCSKGNQIKNNEIDVQGIIPLTYANINGHKILYNEGWSVITSSEKAFDYASEKSIESSGAVILKVAESIVARTKTVRGNMGGRWASSYEMAKKTLEYGTEKSAKIFKGTHQIGLKQFNYSGKKFKDACKIFVYGNISIVQRTKNDVNVLMSLPGGFYKNIKDDFSNILALSNKANSYVGEKINLSWNRSFQKAGRLFHEEYENSGKQKNAFLALGNILQGYLKIVYYGLITPSAKTIVTSGAKGSNYGLFLPASATTIATGRVVESTGLSLYYTTKTGYKLVSPTVTTGLLGGVSILLMGATPVTYLGGTTFGAVNQVAFTMAAPIAGAGDLVATSSGKTGKYVALVTSDIAKGTSKVLINQASAGIVLGYNALSAIPAHLFLGTIDAAVFLAWDGPRLVLAVATGKLKNDISVGNLPVGTVVDLKKMSQNKDVSVKIVSDDPTVVEKIIETIPEDLRGKNENK